MSKKFFRTYLTTCAFVLSFTVFACAQTENQKDFSHVKIRNFGQMDERFYRGGQPKEDEYQSLKDLGIDTVIDLRDNPRDYEKPIVESLGMRYVNIPMSDTKYPPAETIEAFLKLVNDPATGEFFVHCKGGKHRTGVTGAAYRFTKYGWDYDQVYKEMKDFNFYSSWGYGKMKDFVQDYAEKIKIERAKAAATKNAETALPAAQSANK